MIKRKHGAIIAVILVALVLFGALWEGWSLVSNVFEPITVTQKTYIVINTGEDSQGLAQDLYQKGLIKNQLAFRIWAKIQGLDAKLQAGAYQLTPDMNMNQILAKLESGKPDGMPLLIVEGWRIEQIADAIDNLHLANFKKQEFLTEAKDPKKFPDVAKYPILHNAKSMEGLLFPATYAVPLNYNTQQVIDMMLDEFTYIAQTNNLATQAQQNKLTEYQMVILASIVQREVRFDNDMGNVASVYWNRIEKPNDETVGLLDSDPTVQYARDTDNPPTQYWLKLDDQGGNIDPQSLWNTYTNKGWPPTPISSPGLLALKAAAAPAPTNYYFFLSDKDGHNHYAETSAQFQQLENQYLS